jgi:hypothetical protein
VRLVGRRGRRSRDQQHDDDKSRQNALFIRFLNVILTYS